MTRQTSLRIRKGGAVTPLGSSMAIQAALKMAARAAILEKAGFHLVQGPLDDPFLFVACSHRAFENARVLRMAAKACLGVLGCLGMSLSQGMTSVTGKLGMRRVGLFLLMTIKAWLFLRESDGCL